MVVEGTDNQHGGGSVYALNGTNGSVIWRQKINGEVIGGVVSANLGGGHQDVIVASTGGAEVLDGRTGQMLATLERGVGLQNCALVTDDPNGTIGITLAGYNRPQRRGRCSTIEVAAAQRLSRRCPSGLGPCSTMTRH